MHRILTPIIGLVVAVVLPGAAWAEPKPEQQPKSRQEAIKRIEDKKLRLEEMSDDEWQQQQKILKQNQQANQDAFRNAQRDLQKKRWDQMTPEERREARSKLRELQKKRAEQQRIDAIP